MKRSTVIAAWLAISVMALTLACPKASPKLSSPEESEVGAMLDSNDVAQKRLDLRNVVRTLLLAEYKFYDAANRYASLDELTKASPSKPFLDADYADGQLADGTAVVIEIVNDGKQMKVKASRDGMSCFSDETGNMEEDPAG